MPLSSLRGKFHSSPAGAGDAEGEGAEGLCLPWLQETTRLFASATTKCERGNSSCSSDLTR